MLCVNISCKFLLWTSFEKTIGQNKRVNKSFGEIELYSMSQLKNVASKILLMENDRPAQRKKKISKIHWSSHYNIVVIIRGILMWTLVEFNRIHDPKINLTQACEDLNELIMMDDLLQDNKTMNQLDHNVYTWRQAKEV